MKRKIRGKYQVSYNGNESSAFRNRAFCNCAFCNMAYFYMWLVFNNKINNEYSFFIYIIY